MEEGGSRRKGIKNHDIQIDWGSQPCRDSKGILVGRGTQIQYIAKRVSGETIEQRGSGQCLYGGGTNEKNSQSTRIRGRLWGGGGGRLKCKQGGGADTRIIPLKFPGRKVVWRGVGLRQIYGYRSIQRGGEKSKKKLPGKRLEWVLEDGIDRVEHGSKILEKANLEKHNRQIAVCQELCTMGVRGGGIKSARTARTAEFHKIHLEGAKQKGSDDSTPNVASGQGNVTKNDSVSRKEPALRTKASRSGSNVSQQAITEKVHSASHGATRD